MPKVYNKRYNNYPKDAIYVGRPSKWGNPARIGDKVQGRPPVDRDYAIEYFKQYAKARLEYDPCWLSELKGKDLVCWCAPLPCHADVLLELANKEE